MMIDALNTVEETSGSVRDFIERALKDFALAEVYALRPSRERTRCIAWIAAAGRAREEEERVSQLLEALWFEHTLPPVGSGHILEPADRLSCSERGSL